MPEPGPDSSEPGDTPITVAQPGARRSPISSYGVITAVLAVVAVAAAALLAVLWSGHRGEQSDRDYQTRVLAAAADWTEILINMNGGNVEDSMARLRDGTIGELNTGFDKSIAPYRDVVQTLQSTSSGRVESVSIEVIHNAPGTQPGQRSPAPPALPDELSARTQTVLVVATSVSENAAAKSAPPTPGAPSGPTTVRWNLRLGISDVDGAPKISRLESLR